MSDFIGDPIAELRDAQQAKETENAINTITGDLIRNAKSYPGGVRDVPRLATAMEKSIKTENYKEALMRAGQLEKYLESYMPVEENAKEAKLTIRHRLLVLAKLTS